MNIDDHEFYDEKIEYSHSDFQEERNINDESCIYLDLMSDKWSDSKGWDRVRCTAMLSKRDAIMIAKKFKLSVNDLAT
tara:strand:+ start:7820 stop:8053 length:234 start_codon:yes stop_codon:yes gene_type:complete